MIWACRQLAAPLNYLRIRQGVSLFKSKVVYDWVLPIILTVPTVYLSHQYAEAAMFSDGGVVGGFKHILELLAPFFIAALTAVAAFGSEILDKPMKGHPATLSMLRSDGQRIDKVLTRRQFVCYLFGYLSFESLVLFILILFLGAFWPKLGPVLVEQAGDWLAFFKVAALSVFLFFLLQMVVITLLGVYFVTDRLQAMDDPEV